MCIPEGCAPVRRRALAGRQSGLSFVELIMFIVIVGVGLAGILSVLNLTAQRSADPQIRKQMMAIAESLLEEVTLKPYTFCDPDDPQAATAISATVGLTGCLATVEGSGPEGETRYDATLPFDNVNDYNGFSMTGIRDTADNPIGALAAYSATISVANSALGTVPANQSLLVTVSVTGPGSESFVLQGFRTRYAPNAVP